MNEKKKKEKKKDKRLRCDFTVNNSVLSSGMVYVPFFYYFYRNISLNTPALHKYSGLP